MRLNVSLFAVTLAVTLAGWSPPVSATCTDAGPCLAPTVENPSLETNAEVSCLKSDIRVEIGNQRIVFATLTNDCDAAIEFDEKILEFGESSTLPSGEGAQLWGLPGSRENHDSSEFPGDPGGTGKVEYPFTLQGSEPTEGTLTYQYEVTTEAQRSDFHSSCSQVHCSGDTGGGPSQPESDAGSDASSGADAGSDAAASGSSSSDGSDSGCGCAGAGDDSPPLSGTLFFLLALGCLFGRRARR